MLTAGHTSYQNLQVCPIRKDINVYSFTQVSLESCVKPCPLYFPLLLLICTCMLITQEHVQSAGQELGALPDRLEQNRHANCKSPLNGSLRCLALFAAAFDG